MFIVCLGSSVTPIILRSQNELLKRLSSIVEHFGYPVRGLWVIDLFPHSINPTAAQNFVAELQWNRSGTRRMVTFRLIVELFSWKCG